MKTVTLHDGRQVDSWSEEWRHETEARAALAMPLGTRRDFLHGIQDAQGKVIQKGVQQLRGTAEVQRLKDTMMALWIVKQADQLAAMDEHRRERRLAELRRDNGEHIIRRIISRMEVATGRIGMAANDNQADMFGT